jgi:hypothetical protein
VVPQCAVYRYFAVPTTSEIAFATSG